MKTAVMIEGNRNGYHPDQLSTCTIEDLIAQLEDIAYVIGMDAPVFIRNDEGYTYGRIRPYEGDVEPAYYDEHGVYLGYEED